MSVTPEPLLVIEDLSVEFQTRHGPARVLDRINLTLGAGETLGIIGESGCGKSMTALAVMRLFPVPPGRVAGGRVHFRGRDLLGLPAEEMRQIRGNAITMIFQEPMTSLNPVYTVGEQIAETVRLHMGLGRREAARHAVEMLRAVGIPAPERRVDDYPHQLSGGMRQRVMIAIALACKPEIIIADEPTTALDVTVQAQIFDLLREVREKTGTSMILITHDIGAIAQTADRVAVMYAGRVVEEGPVEAILDDPRHPYTRGLIACVPHILETVDDDPPPLEEIPGVVPPLWELGHGCAFAERCRYAMPACRERRPALSQVTEDHRVACLLNERAAQSMEVVS
ncbi:ABC transporter ATP-binding protein [Geminicoccaceae bacterium 1502E]|nr:ABC transporter ATP-binding protein [Geminicoccaceae bacterium 1502E]